MATGRSLDAVTEPLAGKTVDLRSAKVTHTMLVKITGSPAFYEVWLSVSHDGELWLDAASVGGAYPDDHTVYQAGFHGAVRYVRATLSQLTNSPGQEATVTATIGSA